MIESPSQVEERKRKQRAGEEVYKNLVGSFNMQAYDIVFDENDQRRSDQEIKDKQKEMSDVKTDIAQQGIKLQNIEKSQDRLERKLEKVLDEK